MGRKTYIPRPTSELLKAQDVQTRRAPRLTMLEQIEWDKQLETLREAERARESGRAHARRRRRSR
jgi:uncharacterized protein YqgV (UPF0045/DUF77 family)